MSASDTELIGKTISLPGGYDNLLITRKIAEGGFSIVYLAKNSSSSQKVLQKSKSLLSSKHVNSYLSNDRPNLSSHHHQHEDDSAEVTSSSGSQSFALKRIFVNNDVDLLNCQKEISILKNFVNKDHIIKYYSHSIKQLTPDITEVKLLMEYAGGGALIDTMNSRLRSGMNGFESEFIEKVLKDICIAVSYLHHSSVNRPIIHRDLKIENILIGSQGFLICDFGSATDNVVDLSKMTTNEILLYEEEINKVTTQLYKAPEMIDLFSGKRIDTSVDIWALGCLCYNLCFFTLPFDSNLSIQNAVYTVPDDASYRINENILKFISYSLDPNFETRPDIYQLSTLLSWEPSSNAAGGHVEAASSQTMSENIYINYNDSDHLGANKATGLPIVANTRSQSTTSAKQLLGCKGSKMDSNWDLPNAGNMQMNVDPNDMHVGTNVANTTPNESSKRKEFTKASIFSKKKDKNKLKLEKIEQQQKELQKQREERKHNKDKEQQNQNKIKTKNPIKNFRKTIPKKLCEIQPPAVESDLEKLKETILRSRERRQTRDLDNEQPAQTSINDQNNNTILDPNSTSIKPLSRVRNNENVNNQTTTAGGQSQPTDILKEISKNLENRGSSLNNLTKEQVGKLFHKQKEVLLNAENRVIANRKDIALVQERYAKIAEDCRCNPTKIDEYKPHAMQLKECYNQLNVRLSGSVEKYKEIHQKVEILQDLYYRLKVRDKELNGTNGSSVGLGLVHLCLYILLSTINFHFLFSFFL